MLSFVRYRPGFQIANCGCSTDSYSNEHGDVSVVRFYITSISTAVEWVSSFTISCRVPVCGLLPFSPLSASYVCVFNLMASPLFSGVINNFFRLTFFDVCIDSRPFLLRSCCSCTQLLHPSSIVFRSYHLTRTRGTLIFVLNIIWYIHI